VINVFVAKVMLYTQIDKYIYTFVFILILKVRVQGISLDRVNFSDISM